MSEQVGRSETSQAEQIETVDVVVIGAGFVGLAAGAALAASPASHGKVRILESGDSVGHFWVGGHEQLSLHSPYHKLPHDGGLSREYPMFKTKHDVRDYLARYAEAHGLQENLRLGRRVTALEHSAEGSATSSSHPWRVQTDVPGETYLARRVVVATGLNREPHVPRFEGRNGHPALFDGALLAELRELQESTLGLKAVRTAHAGATQFVDCDDPWIVLNMNTPEEYEQARASQGGSSPSGS